MSKFEAMMGMEIEAERKDHMHHPDFVHLEYVGENPTNVSGRSDKFWMVWREGNDMVIKFGKRGTAGQIRRKRFIGETMAKRAIADKVSEKRRDGYRAVNIR